jgi:hypothetical protein
MQCSLLDLPHLYNIPQTTTHNETELEERRDES